MIVYQMGCARGHYFEGWFASGEACERQAAAGQLQCPACSSTDVRKLPAAPHVHTSAAVAAAPAGEAGRREALVALRNLILASTEDVGRRFAEIARRIHYKEEEARGIRGRVTGEEAEELREEGIQALVVSPEVLPTEEVH
ncbi:MAG TPA: DUF1178 family protein [Usitatibacter sp.]|jgi:hypothetical protein|nr:DUF1178 family protein [Usitatibacter sp.]